MNVFSTKINENKVNEIISNYKKYELKSNNVYLLFFAKKNEITINIYKPKSGLYNIVISGKNIESNELVSLLNRYEGDFNIIGSDEAGNGSLIGPIVVSAVKLNKKSLNIISKYNIGDSKKLSENTIEEIYLNLKNIIDNKTIVFSNNDYNDMISKGYNNKSILANLHYKLFQQFNDYDKYIVDGFTNKKLFEKYIKKELPNSFILETKAEDKYKEVAIASIFARYKWNEWFKIESEKIGQNIPKGASKEAYRFVKKISNKKSLVKLDFKGIE